MRDPAAAALFGLGAEDDFGAEFGDDAGAEFGDDDYGAEFGGGPPAAPSQAQLMSLWNARKAKYGHARRRELLLDPNRGSAAKIEQYVFPLSQNVIIGVASGVILDGAPDCTFRPQRLTLVVPTPGFMTISDIKMANVSVSIGPGQIDAFQFNSNGVGQRMDLPTLTPANRARISGDYTGFSGGFPVLSPPSFSYLVSATFIGPASLAGGAVGL
jgi:hypothetical protein